jgi:hypothetical protein
MALRAVLLAAAGVASLAYLALRPKTAPELSREIDLTSLDRHVGNWLPKLPFVPYIQVGTAGRGFLKITGDDRWVQMHLLRIADPDMRASFRRTCGELGLRVHEVAVSGRTADVLCEVPADQADVAPVLDILLRNVFAVDDGSRLVVIVPGDGH